MRKEAADDAAITRKIMKYEAGRRREDRQL